MINRSRISLEMRPRRAARFLIVGALGFGVQIAALAMLTSMAQWSWLPATILSVELAIVHNFLWHARWTWADTCATHLSWLTVPRGQFDDEVIRFVRFNVATGMVSIVGNVVLMALYTGALRVPTVVANGLAVATMAALNFVLADRWIFRCRNHAARLQPDRPRVSNLGKASTRAVLALLIAWCATQGLAEAAPPAETLAAWDRYVGETEARIARGLTHESADKSGFRAARVSPRSIDCEGEGISIANGTISRWRGVVFLPGISLDHLLRRLWEPGTPPPQDDVAAARVLSRTSNSLRVYIRLVRKTIVTVTYDTEHEMRFERWAPGLATARSVATRIDEVGGADHGFLWRLNSYWTYRAVDGGVIVQLESLTLSRSVPMVARPVASPVITRISRESMIRTLEALRRAMQTS